MRIRQYYLPVLWISLLALLAKPVLAELNPSYLLDNRQIDGGIYQIDGTATSIQSTRSATLTLQQFNAVNDVEEQLSFSQQQSSMTTLALSEIIKIKAVAGKDYTSERFQLLDRQVFDGGFGSYDGYDSTSYSTARAIEALGAVKQYSSGVIAPAISFLQDSQQQDGGWAIQDNESSIFVTSYVLSALRYFALSYDLNETLAKARDFIIAQHEADGSYGSVVDTAHALNGLIPITADTAVYSHSVSYLLNQQLGNASWENDVRTTAIVLSALKLSESMTLPTDPSVSVVQGQIVNKTTLDPIPNVLVKVESQSVLSNQDGEFQLPLTDIGSHSIEFSANGYLTATTTINLSQMRNINLGKLKLTSAPSAPSFASITGTVTDQQAQSPLALVEIKLEGPETYLVNSDNNGEYLLSPAIAGDYVLTVTANGYHSAQASVTIALGQHVTFSPSLLSVAEPPSNSTSFSLELIDSVTSAVIPNAVVTVEQTTGSTECATDAQGQLSIDTLVAGSLIIRVQASGYQGATIEAIAATGTHLNIGQVSLPPLDPTSLITIVQGNAVDAESGLPLSGVSISLTGPDSKQILSDIDGLFLLQINAEGRYSLEVSKTGYHTLAAEIDLQLGKMLQFNPSMVNVDSTVPENITLMGRAADDVAGSPIVGAKLTISNNQVITELFSDSNGQWLAENLEPGDIEFSIEAAGYQSLDGSLLAPVGSHIDIGQVAMRLLPSSSTFSGRVIDRVTGDVIAGAGIKLPHSSLESVTDSQGQFNITNIQELTFDISVSAPGYLSNTRTVSTTNYQVIEFDLDIEAVPENEAGFGIRTALSNQANYGAYEKALMDVEFYNFSTTDVQLQMVMQIKGDQGYEESFPATHLAIPGDIADSLLDVKAETKSLQAQFEWLTQDKPAGTYQLIIKAYDLNTLQLLATAQSQVTIEPTQNILGAAASVTPRFSDVGSEDSVGFKLMITHTSNEAFTVPVSYQWSDPQGSVLKQGTVAVEMQPNVNSLSIELTQFDHKFTASGAYTLQVTLDHSSSPDASTVDILVAPKVRVEPSMQVTPGSVIPDGQAKRIHVELKLSGRNEG